MSNRRAFLKLLGIGGAGAVVGLGIKKEHELVVRRTIPDGQRFEGVRLDAIWPHGTEFHLPPDTEANLLELETYDVENARLRFFQK